MKPCWIVVSATVANALFSVGTAHSETWSCAVNEKIGGAHIKQYRVEAKVLSDLTEDKLLREWMPKSDEFLGSRYDILLNNKDTLIAESDYSGLNPEKIKEIYVVNIIIDKGKRQFDNDEYFVASTFP